MGLDRAAFARGLGFVPDSWQEALLRSTSKRVLLNVSRQAGQEHRSRDHRPTPRPLPPEESGTSLRPGLEAGAGVLPEARRLLPGSGASGFSASRKQALIRTRERQPGLILPGTERTIRGFSSAALLIVDEAARIDDPLYHAIRPMVAVSGGALMMLSTPFGRRGVFYEEWSQGEGWDRYEVPATECARNSQEFLEEEKKQSGRYYRQEYMCSFEETEDTIFIREVVEAAFDDEIQPLW